MVNNGMSLPPGRARSLIAVRDREGALAPPGALPRAREHDRGRDIRSGDSWTTPRARIRGPRGPGGVRRPASFEGEGRPGPARGVASGDIE